MLRLSLKAARLALRSRKMRMKEMRKTTKTTKTRQCTAYAEVEMMEDQWCGAQADAMIGK